MINPLNVQPWSRFLGPPEYPDGILVRGHWCADFRVPGVVSDPATPIPGLVLNGRELSPVTVSRAAAGSGRVPV